MAGKSMLATRVALTTADGTVGMDRGTDARPRRGVSDTPPVVLDGRSGPVGISTGQAAALLSERLGWVVTAKEVERVSLALAKSGRLTHDAGSRWEYSPGELDVLAGELWVKKATWRLRRAREGQFDAWVEDAAGT